MTPPATDCYTGNGAGYRGDEAKTNWGNTCQKWSSQSPNTHEYGPKANLGKGLGNHNKCRNPDGVRARPWCYTIDGDDAFEYCDVPQCPSPPSPPAPPLSPLLPLSPPALNFTACRTTCQATTCADFYGKLTCADITFRLLVCTSCSGCCSDISGAQLPPEPEPEPSPLSLSELSPSPVPSPSPR